jgi:hypothetical protein
VGSDRISVSRPSFPIWSACAPIVLVGLLVMSVSPFCVPCVQHVRDDYGHLFTPRRPRIRQFMLQDNIVSVVRIVADGLHIIETAVDPSINPK